MRIITRAVLLLCIATSAFAAGKNRIDAFGAKPGKRNVEASLAAKAGKLLKSASRIHAESRLGVPTMIWADGAAASVSIGPPAPNSEPGAVVAAREHLARYATLYGLQLPDVAAANVVNVHNTGFGPVVVKFQQRVNGVEIFREEMNVLMTRENEIVAIGGYISSASTAAARGSLAFAFDVRNAAAKAVTDVVSIDAPGAQMTLTGSRGGYDYYTVPAASGIQLDEPVRVKKVYYHQPEGLEPAYYVEVLAHVPSETSVDGGTELEGYSYVISAVDGTMLFRHNLTSDAHEGANAGENAPEPTSATLGGKVRGKVAANGPLAPGGFTYRVWADPITGLPYDSPAGNSVHPKTNGIPDGAQFPFLAQQDVTLPNFPFSQNDPWLPPGSTETVGNNVDAFVNLVTPDGYGPVMNPPADPATGDFRAKVTAPDQFLHSHTAGTEPKTAEARQANVQQMFYNVNFLHDWFYDAGFDESSRNAQASNYGRGGLENDIFVAQGQDVQSRNNANMLTPADGSKPRMRMYLFDTNATKYVNVLSPASAAGARSVGTGQFGPQTFDVTNELIAANPIDGCTAGAYTGVAGKFVLVNRDLNATCSIGTKLGHAMTAGAAGFILVNNQSTPTQAVNVTGSLPSFTIPFLSISWNNAISIKAALAVPEVVTVRMRRDFGLDRDGTIDTQIMFHEWGHYLTNRLVGNSGGLITNHSAGMGEGWGDFTALLLTVRPEDTLNPTNTNFDGAYALATYATSGGENNGYYYGIRRTPYSTDMATKNALTFHHIMDGVPLPVGPPILGGGVNSQVHNTGEVWATMLWECYASLLRDTLGASPRLSFEQAQERMKQYYVASLKMTPVAPTFLEARDAVLAAAYATDYTDYVLFQQAFAKRGAGINAVAPDRWSTNNSGIVQSFSTAPEVAFHAATLTDGIAACDNDGILDAGEVGLLNVTLKNVGTQTLTGTMATITANTPGVTLPNGSNITFLPVDSLDTVTGSLQVRLAPDAAGGQDLSFTIDFSDPQVAGPRSTMVSLAANLDVLPATSATDSVESPIPAWTTSSAPPIGADSAGRLYVLGIASPFRVKEVTPLQHQWFGPNEPIGTDERLTSPVFTVDGSGSVNMQFDHSWNFEFDGSGNYDGGVVEMSVNGGAWTDAGTGTYTGTLVNYSGNVNPLRTRQAYVANSPGTVHTSTTKAVAPGSTVQFRFRLGSDGGLGAAGWNIDNIAFTGVVETPFATVVADTGCTLPTTTALLSSANPSPAGSPLTLTATVSAGAAGTVNSGNVTFFDGLAAIGTMPVASGTAVFNTSSLTQGSHSLTARFDGIPGLMQSTSPAVTQAIGKPATTTALGANHSTTSYGQTVTLTATVSAVSGTPAGSVQFFDGATPIGTSPLVAGIATLNISTMTPATHQLTATYGGNASFSGSTSSAFAVVVNAAATTTGLGTTNANPTYPNSVTLTATVTSTFVTPNGSVTFFDGATPLATVALNGSGIATHMVVLSGGAHSLTAQYLGNTNFVTSTSDSVPHNVTKATTTLTVSAPWPLLLPFHNIVFTATITNGATGSVTFKDGASTLGSGTISAGVATFNQLDLPLGEHTITAEYAGDVNHTAVTSAPITITVVPTVHNDFTGDAKPDLVWRNYSTGQTSIWHMDGRTWTGNYTLQPHAGAAWILEAAADLNSDGHQDLIWRNSTTGQVTAWMMSGQLWDGVSYVSLGTAPANWEIGGAGDVNGDGQNDLVWRNSSTGQNALWLLNGTTWNNAWTYFSGVYDLNWKIKGVADFNDDGKADIVWHHTNGQGSIWLMAGTTWGGNFASLPKVSDTTWSIANTGDYDGDGDPDLVWRNNSGMLSIWIMNGTTWTGDYTIVVPNVPTAWWIMGNNP